MLIGARVTQEATSELFDGSWVNLQIEAFSEFLRGKSESNHTLQNVSDLCEHLHQYGENERRDATDGEIEELMLKLCKESFEFLDESEKTQVAQFAREVTKSLDLKIPPFERSTNL